MSIAFAEKLDEYVQFPKTLEGQRRNIRKFYEIAEFPNIAACIDGTLIKVANPDKEIGEIFRSRKGSFSLNILVILYNYLNCNEKYCCALYMYICILCV